MLLDQERKAYALFQAAEDFLAQANAGDTQYLLLAGIAQFQAAKARKAYDEARAAVIARHNPFLTAQFATTVTPTALPTAAIAASPVATPSPLPPTAAAVAATAIELPIAATAAPTAATPQPTPARSGRGLCGTPLALVSLAVLSTWRMRMVKTRRARQDITDDDAQGQ